MAIYIKVIFIRRSWVSRYLADLGTIDSRDAAQNFPVTVESSLRLVFGHQITHTLQHDRRRSLMGEDKFQLASGIDHVGY